jgi:hypothetical protein
MQNAKVGTGEGSRWPGHYGAGPNLPHETCGDLPTIPSPSPLLHFAFCTLHFAFPPSSCFAGLLIGNILLKTPKPLSQDGHPMLISVQGPCQEVKFKC